MCSIYINIHVHASDFDICIQDKGVSYYKPCVVFAVIHEIWKFIIYNKINKRMRHFYRVSHIEVCKVNQLWGVKRSIIFLKYGDPHGLITPSTQMTNTSPFLRNGSSNIQFFTDIWYSFCWRLLRPADVIFLKTSLRNSNVRTSWSH